MRYRIGLTFCADPSRDLGLDCPTDEDYRFERYRQMSEELRRVAAFCPLCISCCGCEAVVEDGRLVTIEPDPSHRTGKALCAKGRAAPELVEARDRLLYPLRRTRPKGDPDPGWQRITWDEALNHTATAMHRIASESGPEAVAFAIATSVGTAISDAAP